MPYFTYGDTEINYLKSKDKKLGRVIDSIGIIQRETEPDLFTALIHSIVGQQISAKAVKTIWQRILDLIGQVTPSSILSVDENTLQQCGISFRKVSYIRGVASMVLDGSLDIENLRSKSEDEVFKELVRIPGIGIWTAEMLMIFSMERPNVFSYGDLAILRGLCILYGHKEIPKERFEKYRKRFSPYCSVASLYLWAIAGGQMD